MAEQRWKRKTTRALEIANHGLPAGGKRKTLRVLVGCCCGRCCWAAGCSAGFLALRWFLGLVAGLLLARANLLRAAVKKKLVPLGDAFCKCSSDSVPVCIRTPDYALQRISVRPSIRRNGQVLYPPNIKSPQLYFWTLANSVFSPGGP